MTTEVGTEFRKKRIKLKYPPEVFLKRHLPDRPAVGKSLLIILVPSSDRKLQLRITLARGSFTWKVALLGDWLDVALLFSSSTTAWWGASSCS